MLPFPTCGAAIRGAEPLPLTGTADEELSPQDAIEVFVRDLALPLSPRVVELLARSDELMRRIHDASRRADMRDPPSLAERLDPVDQLDIVSLLRAMPAPLLPWKHLGWRSRWMRFLLDPVASGMPLPRDLHALEGLHGLVWSHVDKLNRLSPLSGDHDPNLARRLAALVQWEQRLGLAPGTHPQQISDALKSLLWSEMENGSRPPEEVRLDNPTHSPVWPPLDLLRRIGPLKDGLRLILGEERPADARAFAEHAAAAGTRAMGVDLRAGEAWPEALCIDGVLSLHLRADDRSTLNAALRDITRRMPQLEHIDLNDDRQKVIAPDGWALDRNDRLKRQPPAAATAARRQDLPPTLGGGLALL